MTSRILGVTTALLILSTLTVALRLFTRFVIVRKPGWDDALIVAAVGTNYVFYACLIIELRNHLGEKEDAISEHDMRTQLKALWVSIPFYNLTLTLAKISMILLYMRLFVATNKRFRILLIAFLVFLIIVGLWILFSTFLICLPVRGFWDHSVPATCRPFAVVWCLNAALQIVTDTVVVTTPIPILARLRLPTRQKFALILVFALGFFVCAMSIIRLVRIIQLVSSDSEDFSERNGPAATWSSIEANVAIICTCLPPTHPLLTRICPRLLSPRPSARDSQRQHQREKELPSVYSFHLHNPFAVTSGNYSASVTGNCSVNGDELQDTDGIQVVSELRWDLDHAHRRSGSIAERESAKKQRRDSGFAG
ncbi:hypothetical protein Aspvir_005355 [Aspergillus viridinutans]|uniref:Rhodopsin domain-containing protein n=1 Tax=Aspergillus viridinutans TaxID=75553 RepID=A0A9P3BWU9_ASPVI|nr:uncharacterized protein Aspvir_005355 [Aspergillus viridinutans]GIK01321.1 hypothetical protein Aspvir_005355 [Aspergillus viridinutans]